MCPRRTHVASGAQKVVKVARRTTGKGLRAHRVLLRKLISATGPINDNEDDDRPMNVPSRLSVRRRPGGLPGPMDCIYRRPITLRNPARCSICLTVIIAKQAYQLAVAQQVMRDAVDEWERGRAISGRGSGGRSSIAASSNAAWAWA
ncbi:hypothetical protein BJY52DRAFT_1418217 [Lactarius psammicola]|nr:hypothetical protein BJY52DRAFT_1418217 [Lactarius psammicola]